MTPQEALQDYRDYVRYSNEPDSTVTSDDICRSANNVIETASQAKLSLENLIPDPLERESLRVDALLH